MEKLERYFDNVINVYVILSVEKQCQKVEVRLYISGVEFYVDVVNGDMYVFIDVLVDKLDCQIKKYKEKMIDYY